MVIEKGITIAGKTIREHLEAINHIQAIDFIRDLADKKRQEIALDDILVIYKKISAKAPFLMTEFMSWLHEVVDHPILVAALAHYKLVMIHPFVDGNGLPAEALAKEGRTARLLMNLLLLQYGYPLAIIKKEQRSEYIAAIEYAGNTGNYDDFYAIIISAVEYSLDIYFDAIEQSNLL
jgi:Fic family protein